MGLFVRTDVSSAESAAAMVEATVAAYGGIDLLVNNAAIYGDMQFDLLISVDWDYYRKFMSVNMDGALVMTRACYREMQKRGGGAIVNQSSTAAYLYSGFYGLAKVGVNGLTQQLAHELGGMGIRVNAIAPGPTDTAATRTQAGDAAKELVKGMAIKRMGQPEDMVGACLFLLSDESGWLTGQIIAVDGGQTFRVMTASASSGSATSGSRWHSGSPPSSTCACTTWCPSRSPSWSPPARRPPRRWPRPLTSTCSA